MRPKEQDHLRATTMSHLEASLSLLRVQSRSRELSSHLHMLDDRFIAGSVLDGEHT